MKEKKKKKGKSQFMFFIFKLGFCSEAKYFIYLFQKGPFQGGGRFNRIVANPQGGGGETGRSYIVPNNSTVAEAHEVSIELEEGDNAKGIEGYQKYVSGFQQAARLYSESLNESAVKDCRYRGINGECTLVEDTIRLLYEFHDGRAKGYEKALALYTKMESNKLLADPLLQSMTSSVRSSWMQFWSEVEEVFKEVLSENSEAAIPRQAIEELLVKLSSLHRTALESTDTIALEAAQLKSPPVDDQQEKKQHLQHIHHQQTERIHQLEAELAVLKKQAASDSSTIRKYSQKWSELKRKHASSNNSSSSHSDVKDTNETQSTHSSKSKTTNKSSVSKSTDSTTSIQSLRSTK